MIIEAIDEHEANDKAWNKQLFELPWEEGESFDHKTELINEVY